MVMKFWFSARNLVANIFQKNLSYMHAEINHSQGQSTQNDDQILYLKFYK